MLAENHGHSRASICIFKRQKGREGGSEEKRERWRKKGRKEARKKEVLSKATPLFEVHAADANFYSIIQLPESIYLLRTNATDLNHKILFSHS